MADLTGLVIHKARLGLIGIQTIQLPVAARILSVQVQGASVALWYLKHKDQKNKVGRTIRIVGTGHELDFFPGTFLGTLQTPPYVWHVFDQGEVEAKA